MSDRPQNGDDRDVETGEVPAELWQPGSADGPAHQRVDGAPPKLPAKAILPVGDDVDWDSEPSAEERWQPEIPGRSGPSKRQRLIALLADELALPEKRSTSDETSQVPQLGLPPPAPPALGSLEVVSPSISFQAPPERELRPSATSADPPVAPESEANSGSDPKSALDLGLAQSTAEAGQLTYSASGFNEADSTGEIDATSEAFDLAFENVAVTRSGSLHEFHNEAPRGGLLGQKSSTMFAGLLAVCGGRKWLRVVSLVAVMLVGLIMLAVILAKLTGSDEPNTKEVAPPADSFTPSPSADEPTVLTLGTSTTVASTASAPVTDPNATTGSTAAPVTDPVEVDSGLVKDGSTRQFTVTAGSNGVDLYVKPEAGFDLIVTVDGEGQNGLQIDEVGPGEEEHYYLLPGRYKISVTGADSSSGTYLASIR